MYKIKELGFNYNALEPIISEETLKYHYQIYKNHVINLNSLIDTNYTLEQLIKKIEEYPINIRDDILYHAGAILNHEMYFNTIKPNNSVMSNKLRQNIINDYGSVDNFYNKLIEQSSYLVGSGYTYVILNKNNIEIINISNEDNPYMYNLIPLFNIDLWEHSYYLDYNLNREKYVNNFLNLVNFDYINKIYEIQ